MIEKESREGLSYELCNQLSLTYIFNKESLEKQPPYILPAYFHLHPTIKTFKM